MLNKLLFTKESSLIKAFRFFFLFQPTVDDLDTFSKFVIFIDLCSNKEFQTFWNNIKAPTSL